jgi:glycosyltransferase involved in cell wall biosynthesis
MTDRLRIAYFSPLPPARSGIADYSAELLPCLQEAADVTLYCDQPERVDVDIRSHFRCLPTSNYPGQCWTHDIAIYQIGNSLWHDTIYDMATRYPGVVVLHDLSLHQFISTRAFEAGNHAQYVRELAYCLGPAGYRLAARLAEGLEDYPYSSVPLTNRLLDTSLAAIVHSETGLRSVQALSPELPVYKVLAPIGLQQGHSLRTAWTRWPADAIVFGSVGQIIEGKRIEHALRLFAQVRADLPQARYVVVGESLDPGNQLDRVIRELDLLDDVYCPGFVDTLPELLDWIASLDVLVNLREPTLGETSASALRGLAAGKPVIVSAHGWYAELPDDVCIKVKPGDDADLLLALRSLGSDASRRAEVGKRAAEYTARIHAPARATEGYLALIHSLMDRVRGQGT